MQSFPAGRDKQRASSKGGDWARWRRNGEMFYIAADRRVMSVAVRAVSGSLELGNPQALFTIPVAPVRSGDDELYTYDVTPDGERFFGAGASRGRCIANDDGHCQLASGAVGRQEVIVDASL